MENRLFPVMLFHIKVDTTLQSMQNELAEKTYQLVKNNLKILIASPIQFLTGGFKPKNIIFTDILADHKAKFAGEIEPPAEKQG